MSGGRRLSWRTLGLSMALLALGACTWIGGDRRGLGPTLADLPPAVLPPPGKPVAPATLDQIEESYRAALAVTSAPELRQGIEVRLADLEMARSEDRQLSSAEQRDFFSGAIALYDALLDDPDIRSDAVVDERLLYRLSKAYALDGRMAESDEVLARLVAEYPASPYAAEAEFRRAELAFSRGEYREAQALYRQVLAVGDTTPFYLNALYMLGWSQFKASDFNAGIESFTGVLDRLLPDDDVYEQLSGASRGMVEDTLRVLGITFSYLDGAEAIAEAYADLGPRDYLYRIYAQLGELYLERELFTYAADVYGQFIRQFPDADQGPDFAVRRIEVYQRGGFVERILPSKEAFVVHYGIDSAYWAARDAAAREPLLPHLENFLNELASYYHAEGQALAAARGARSANATSSDQAFLRAADYYDRFLRTFPGSARTAEITFLMAEAYFEADRLVPAVAAYERVAYELLDAERGATAGHAAILALQAQQRTAAPQDQPLLRDRTNRSAVQFADVYPDHPQATSVLAAAAEDLFAQEDSAAAEILAQRLVDWQPAPTAALRRAAWLILAHGAFDRAEYPTAQAAYESALALMPPQDPARPGIVDRIAASVFKHGESLAASGDTASAVARLLEVQSVAPDSEAAIAGQYDAGHLLLEQQDWLGAERIFLDFRQRYGSHALTASLAPRLVAIYQATEQWGKAALVLGQMASTESDPETRRQSLFLSAELHQKSGNSAEAVRAYNDYVRLYPQPFALATEARYQLLQLAEQQGDNKAREQWLSRLIDAHQRAGDDRTDRSRYLAAYASNQQARQAFARFEAIKLTLPIRRSLTAKRNAMDATLKAYQQVLDYGVGEFVTEANYRIGNVYAQLARDLIQSERPKGLDELALEQYEILLEEQAEPFEEKSIELLAIGAERAWEGFYDQWVQQSLTELARILPARYGKQEYRQEVSRGLH